MTAPPSLPDDIPMVDSAPPPVTESYRPRWPSIGWAAMVGLLAAGAIRFLIGWIAVMRELPRSQPVDDRDLQRLMLDLKSLLGCRTFVELRESARLTTAATFGWRRPVILLPRCWRNWTVEERRVVLAHELAHIARGHFAGWCAAQFGLSLHVYHPLLHWLAARLRLEQEYEADSLAAEAAGGTATYLRTLARLALQDSEAAVVWPARAFLPSRGTVVRRIQMLSNTNKSSKPSPFLRGAAIALLLCGGGVAAGLRRPLPAAGIESIQSGISTEIATVDDGESPNGPPSDLTAVGADASESTTDESTEHVVISGRVTDRNGNPAVGAFVILPIEHGWGETRRGAVQATTDSEGRYNLRVPAAWGRSPAVDVQMQSLWAHQPGFALATAQPGRQLHASEPRRSVDLVLPAESRPQFQFLDEVGQPVTDATVEIHYYRRWSSSSDALPREILDRIASPPDAAGNVTLNAVESGQLSAIRVRSNRHGTQVFQTHGGRSTAQLQLRAAAPVRGRIVAEKPEWARKRRMVFITRADRTDDGFRHPEGWADVVTDDDGRFEIPRIASGELLLRSLVEDNVPARLEMPETVKVPANAPLSFRMVPGVVARGRVVRQDGSKPVPGVSVRVGTHHQLAGFLATTDTNGEFEVRVLPGTVHQQVFPLPEMELIQVEFGGVDIPATSGNFTLPTIPLRGTYARAGRLIDEDGNGVAQWEVSVLAGRHFYGHAVSDDTGAFDLRIPEGVPIESYHVRSRANEGGAAVVVTEDPLVLRVVPSRRAANR